MSNSWAFRLQIITVAAVLLLLLLLRNTLRWILLTLHSTEMRRQTETIAHSSYPSWLYLASAPHQSPKQKDFHAKGRTEKETTILLCGHLSFDS